jgi:hypothetical protein
MDAMARPVGRPPLNIRSTNVRQGVSTFGRIDKVRAPKESLSGFIRKAVEHELQRREAEKKKPGRK